MSVRAGATWMATNTDKTLPSPRGPLPGNGSLVAVLRTALDREPDVVVGKPAPALFTTAASLSKAQRPLTVGDRLDTDIEGAVNAGMDSLLVLTGVSGPAELLSAPPERRPTYVAGDLSGLFAPADDARIPLDERRGRWLAARARRFGGRPRGCRRAGRGVASAVRPGVGRRGDPSRLRRGPGDVLALGSEALSPR